MWAHLTCLAAGAAREVHEKAPMEAHFCVQLQGRGGRAPEHKIVPTVGTFSYSGAGEATRGYPNMKMCLWGRVFVLGSKGGEGGHLNIKIVPMSTIFVFVLDGYPLLQNTKNTSPSI